MDDVGTTKSSEFLAGSRKSAARVYSEVRIAYDFEMFWTRTASPALIALSPVAPYAFEKILVAFARQTSSEVLGDASSRIVDDRTDRKSVSAVFVFNASPIDANPTSPS